MTNSEHQRVRRDAARAAKLCLVCCKRPATNGSRCTTCKPAVSASPRSDIGGTHKKRERDDSFCLECLMGGGHRNDCPVRQVAPTLAKWRDRRAA